jgi:hypothetical protein
VSPLRSAPARPGLVRWGGGALTVFLGHPRCKLSSVGGVGGEAVCTVIRKRESREDGSLRDQRPEE